MNTKKGSSLTQSVDKNTTTTSTQVFVGMVVAVGHRLWCSLTTIITKTPMINISVGGIKKLSIWDEYYNKEWITDAQVNTSIDKKNLS